MKFAFFLRFTLIILSFSFGCLAIYTNSTNPSYFSNNSSSSFNTSNCTNYDQTTNICIIDSPLFLLNLSDDATTMSFTKLVIKNASLTCVGIYRNCSLRITSDSIEITNSTLYFGIIELFSEVLSISYSIINTNGTIRYGKGITPNCSNGTYYDSTYDTGIGYAGGGAFCQDLYPHCGLPYGGLTLLMNQTNDSDYLLGSGTGQNFFGTGGGRIIINTTDLNFDGTIMISASGSPQSDECLNRAANEQSWNITNGGTGGYIFIGVRGFVNSSKNVGVSLFVEGGNYCDANDVKYKRFAGSGGRIIIDADTNNTMSSNISYYLKGGINDPSVPKSNINPCRNGASGTLYYIRNNSVVLKNSGFQANSITKIPCKGIYGLNFNTIIIADGARGGPEDYNPASITASRIIVNSGYLAYERFYMNITLIITDYLYISGTKDNLGGIGPPELNSKSTSAHILAHNVTFTNNSTILFGKDFSLKGDIVVFNGNINSYFSDSGLYVASFLNFSIQNALIEVSKIGLYNQHGLFIKNSRIKAFKKKCKEKEDPNLHNYINLLPQAFDITKYKPELNLGEFDILKYIIETDENYTLLIITQQDLTLSFDNSTSTDLTKNTIQGANIGLLAPNITISTGFIVSSEDLGCVNEQGPGKGGQDTNLGNKCGGTGGSYGGYGSLAWSNYADIFKDCLKIMNSGIYGKMENPMYEGSGGGGNQKSLNPGGKGGGVVIIVSNETLIINGTVSSSGSSPETQMGMASAGAGAGGSIQLVMKYLKGNGIVKSEGGSTAEGGIGGPGSGGRIRLNFSEWHNKEGNYSGEWVGLFSVIQGRRSQVINFPDDFDRNMERSTFGKGTISTTPCMPGHYGSACGLCPIGKYKNRVGEGYCFDCANKPNNAYYDSAGETNPMCHYECNNFINYEAGINPNCYSNVDYYINKIGGIPGVVGIVLALILFFILILIKFIQRRRKSAHIRDSFDKNQLILDENNPALKNELPRMVFCMEDMPYHLKRIYLVGENNIYNHWCLNQNDCLDITHHEIEIIKNNDFLQLINERMKYNTFMKFLIISIKWIYYPLYYLLMYILRKRKCQIMVDFLPELKILYHNQDSINADEVFKPLILKFSTSSDITLGYIDIFNYNKSILEWSSIKFPICLILAGEGSFLFPLSLSQFDPLVKTLGSIINEIGENKDKDIWDLESNETDPSQKNVAKKKTINFQDFLKGFNENARRIDFCTSFHDFTKNVIDLLEYVDDSNNEFFNKKNMRAEIFLHQILENNQSNKETKEQTSISFLDRSSKEQLEKYLKEAHSLKHYNHSFNIKFSLNLIKNEDMSERSSLSMNKNELNFDFLMKRPLNIEEEAKTFHSDDDLNCLKEKLLIRLDNEKPLKLNKMENRNDKKWDLIRAQWMENLTIWFNTFERFLGYCRSIILRFRESKERSSILPIGLFFLMIVDLIVLFIDGFIIFGNKFQIIAGTLYPYPLSILISTVLFVFWFGCYQYNIVLGRLFLIYDAQSMLNMIIGFLVSCSPIFDITPLERVVNLFFAIEKLIILYVGSKFISLK